MAELRLGGLIDTTTGKRSGEGAPDFVLPSDEFTTHGIIVGMTGSGKTGLGVVLIEEVLSAGIPALLIDPKGDLTNLELTFPALAPADFRPWIDESQASKAGQTPDEYAAAQAASWSNGLAGWGYGGDEIQRLRDTVDVTIYTPGSSAGVGLNVVGSLDVPTTDDEEAISDQIEGFVTGLLSLVGITADPLSSREHVLLSNLIHHSWSNGQALDLPTLVGQVQQPPIVKLGVIELEQFYPERDRRQFAVRLNGLLASPSFAAWGDGVPLDIQSMLYTADGRPRCAIVTTAHLDDEERQFITTLVLGKLITWMRAQSGTGNLRALLYMDEVAGYLPPTAMPPTKKPIMTLMKQARAFGVGVVLSTQNPVDLDYKAISNAGTWMVGRLQTEQDRNRLIDGMSSADGGVDVKAVGSTIAALDKRQFVVRRAGRNEPSVFTTRWAMSYLRGPMTRDQIRALRGAGTTASPAPTTAAAPASAAAAGGTARPASDAGAAAAAAAAVIAAAAAAAAGGTADVPAADPTSTGAATSGPTSADPTPGGAATPDAASAAPRASVAAGDTTPVMPNVASGIAVRWLSDPVAVGALGGSPGSSVVAPGVLARVHARYDQAKIDLAHDVDLSFVVFPIVDRLDPTMARDVDIDDAALDGTAPTGAHYRIVPAPLGESTAWKQFERGLVDHLVRARPLTLATNTALKLTARPDEDPEAFAIRCRAAADEAAATEIAKSDEKHATRSAKLLQQRQAAADRARVVEEQAKERKRGRLLKSAGDVIGGILGSRQSAASKIGRAVDGITSNSDETRVDEARNRVARFDEQIVELDAAQAATHAEITRKWAATAAAVTEVKVALKKTNVSITSLTLAWLPSA